MLLTLSRNLLQLSHSRSLAVNIVQNEMLLGPELEGFDYPDRERRLGPRNGLVR